MTKPWIPKTAEEAYKRAAGRRRYHAVRRKAQWKRQQQVLGELVQANWENYGKGRMLAKKLGVSQATISRDIRHWRLIRHRLGVDANEILSDGLRRWQAY